jgi:hypothetical protein
MSADRRRTAVAGAIFSSLVLSVVPACTAAGGAGSPGAQAVSQSPDGRVAFRPPYGVKARRPMYPPAYAGVSYPPLFPPQDLTPARYQAPLGRPFGWCFRGGWFGR